MENGTFPLRRSAGFLEEPFVRKAIAAKRKGIWEDFRRDTHKTLPIMFTALELQAQLLALVQKQPVRMSYSFHVLIQLHTTLLVCYGRARRDSYDSMNQFLLDDQLFCAHFLMLDGVLYPGPCLLELEPGATARGCRLWLLPNSSLPEQSKSETTQVWLPHPTPPPIPLAALPVHAQKFHRKFTS